MPLGGMSEVTIVLLLLSIILMAGFVLTRFTKRIKLPNVSGYIIAGIIIGPYVLNLIPREFVANMSFVSDIALAFISFGVGRFFKKKSVQTTGLPIITITLLQSLLAGALVTSILYFAFGVELRLALLLGAIATSTAPASTAMTINQYRARGKFVDMLLQTIALDNVICLLVFSIAVSVVEAVQRGSISYAHVLLPIAYNVGMMLLGAVFAVVLNRLLSPPTRSRENRLIITTALLLGLTGICSVLEVSPLLSCMTFGAIYMNIAKDKKLYKQLNVFTPPIMLLFFVVSGMNLDLSKIASIGILGVAYFFIRIVGKYVGAYLGCLISKTEAPIRKLLGMALVPQAGVAIGLAYLAQRTLSNGIGDTLMTIILASSVLYELIGPASAKFALFRSGAIQQGEKPAPPTAEMPEDSAPEDDFLPMN